MKILHVGVWLMGLVLPLASWAGSMGSPGEMGCHPNVVIGRRAACYRPLGSAYRVVESPRMTGEITYSQRTYPYYPYLRLRNDCHDGSPFTLAVDIQTALYQRGYYRAPIDGVLGTATREAIRSYQADQGLLTNGRIDFHLVRSLGLG